MDAVFTMPLLSCLKLDLSVLVQISTIWLRYSHLTLMESLSFPNEIESNFNLRTHNKYKAFLQQFGRIAPVQKYFTSFTFIQLLFK